MRKALNREKIIKAAKCCGEQKLCKDCPYNCGSRYCMYILREDTRLLVIELTEKEELITNGEE